MARRGYPSTLTLLPCAALFGGGCLLFTDQINGVPDVEVSGPTELTRNEKKAFMARGSDPEQSAETLTYEWRSSATCPATLSEANAGPPIAQGKGTSTAEVTATSTGPLCVWVVVRDDQGAAAFNTHAATVKPGLPKAKIDVLAGKLGAPGIYALYNAFRLSGAKSEGSDRDDQLTFSWMLTSPGAQPAIGPPCREGLAKDICFTADTPGEYLVLLTIKDQVGGMNTTSLKLQVDEDRPPCIEQTTPAFSSPALPMLVWEPDKPRSIQLHAATDDGDPFPEDAFQSQNVMEWSYRRSTDTDYTRYPPMRSPQLPWPIVPVVPGEVIYVRLRYTDRVPRDFSTCERDAVMNCRLPTVREDVRSCYQWVTWKINVL